MQIKIYSPREFSALESDWKTLETGSDMTVFQSYDWFVNINNLYFKEHIKRLFREWIYVVVYENEEAVMIAPIQIVKLGLQYKNLGLARGAYFIGRQGYSDYLNFIYNKFSYSAVKKIINFLSEKYHIKRFCFEQLLENTDFYCYLNSNYKLTQSNCYCASLELPDSFEDYNKTLSKSTRQNLRTAINRQKREGLELTHELVYELDDDTLTELMHIRDQRLKDKQKKAYSKASLLGKIYNHLRNVVRYLFDAKHDVIRECCNYWAFLVKDGNRIVGYYWGLRSDLRGEYYVILAGVDKDYAWFSPTLSHFYLYIKELYETENKSIRVFDFTRGGERYKTDLGGVRKDALTVVFS